MFQIVTTMLPKADLRGNVRNLTKNWSRLFKKTHQKYPAMGLDAIYHYLKPSCGASRARIHRLMKKCKIHSCRVKTFKKTTNSNHSLPISPNLLNGNFYVDAPNKVWVGDITYIPTGEGWLYLAVVKDLYTKKVVGYSFSNRIDAELVCDALNKAVFYQRPSGNLIFHSDKPIRFFKIQEFTSTVFYYSIYVTEGESLW